MLYRTVQVQLAVKMRRVILEKHFGIDMQKTQIISIGFERKEFLGMLIPAQYDQEHQRILFDPLTIEAPIPFEEFLVDVPYPWFSKKHYVLRSIVDHELGHAYADMVSRELGNGPWPNWNRDGYAKDPFRHIASRIISEGIGSYFERASVIHKGDSVSPDMRLGPMRGVYVLRNGGYLVTPNGQDFIYGKGYWLVKPILDIDVRRGVEYIITHPFVITKAKFVESAEAYQAQALRALSSPPSS